MKRTLLILLSVLALCTPASAAPDTVVVCPTGFRDALKPWLEYRTQQGHQISVLEPDADRFRLRDRIHKIAKQGALKFIVLVGDVKSTKVDQLRTLTNSDLQDKNASPQNRLIPTHLRKARVNIHWGGAPDLACDNWYADLDEDTIPDVAIGRLTADSPAELTQIVSKIIAYESDKNFGMWRRKANFVAGVGGFGFLADKALESATRTVLTRGIPAAYAINMTQASWQSPYCPHPTMFQRACSERMNDGCLFWVYIGHGNRRRLDRVRVPGAVYPIFDTGDVPKIKAKHGLPIAIFLACHTGAIDAHEDCLAEELLRQPGGPVAVLAGSRVTMPYGMGVFGIELIEQVFTHGAPTLGEAICKAQTEAVKKKAEDPFRGTLDMLAKTISPKGTDLLAEREETIHQFNLIGDPLMRLPQPKQIEISANQDVTAGEKLIVRGRSPVEGPVMVELTTQRGQLRFRAPRRTRYEETREAMASFAKMYREANNSRYASGTTQVKNGEFEVSLDVPAEVNGKCRIRAYVEGAAGYALGAKNIEVLEATRSLASEGPKAKNDSQQPSQ